MKNKFWYFVALFIFENGEQHYHKGYFSDRDFPHPTEMEQEARDLANLSEERLKSITQTLIISCFEVGGGAYAVWRENHRKYFESKKK